MAGLLGLFWVLSPTGNAQRPRSAPGGDPFITAIETTRRSVASLDCLAINSTESRILERIGSAFLVSGAGDFLTAAHVILEMYNPERSCPTPANILPAGDWHPEARSEPMRWFPFKASDCRIDPSLDVAMCRLTEDLSTRKLDLHLKAAPLQFEWKIPPDGTQVAFTGFPLRARDPMTFRADVAAFRMPWPDDSTPEMVLDRATLPGFSGSPVYLADGKVVAIVVKEGKDEATGVTIARPASAFRVMLEEKQQKE